MMNPEEFPRVLPQYIPALEVALDHRAEAKAKMADFKKKYASVKAKVKRLEKDMAAMEEATEAYYIRNMGHDVQLAINKFVLIDKKLKRFENDCERYCKRALKTLSSPKGFDPNQTLWHIDHVRASLNHTNSILSEVLDMLRIAKGHLAKVDATKKSMAKYRANHLRLQAIRGQNEEAKRQEADAQQPPEPPTTEQNKEDGTKRSWWQSLLGR